jgi:hypothetical protein
MLSPSAEQIDHRATVLAPSTSRSRDDLYRRRGWLTLLRSRLIANAALVSRRRSCSQITRLALLFSRVARRQASGKRLPNEALGIPDQDELIPSARLPGCVPKPAAQTPSVSRL